MSEENKVTAAEASKNEENQQQATTVDVDTPVEASEEKKETERPGVCCGSCS